MQQHGSKYFTRRPPPPPTLGVESIGQNQKVMLHIKLKGMTHAATW